MALQFTNISDIVRENTDSTGRTGTRRELLEEVSAPQVAPQDIAAPAVDDLESVTANEAIGGAEVPLTPMAEKKARIEEEIGEQVHASRGSAGELAAAIRDGVVCKVHIKRERFQTKTTAAEMGVSRDVASQVLSGLGNKLLAPKDILGQMNSADTMARNLLARFGIKTPWGRFIPTCNWAAFKEAFLHQREAYYSALARLITMMADGRHETWIIQQYTAFAYDRWKYVRDNYEDSLHPAGSCSEMDAPPPGFISSVVDAARARIPDHAVVAASAEFSYELSVVQAPDTLLARECATEDSDLNRELIQHMNDRKRSLIDDFLRAAHEGLAEHISGLADSVGKTLVNKATVHGKTINRILGALAEMRSLNVTNNQDFESKIDELESFIEGKKSGAKNSPISSQEVLDRLRATASSVNESLSRDLHSTSQFANLGA